MVAHHLVIFKRKETKVKEMKREMNENKQQ